MGAAEYGSGQRPCTIFVIHPPIQPFRIIFRIPTDLKEFPTSSCGIVEAEFEPLL